MVKVRVIEKTGEFMALIQVTETSGSIRECYVPKIFLDLVKANLPSMNMGTILARSSDNTYNLS